MTHWKKWAEHRMMYLDSVEPFTGRINIVQYARKFGISDVTARSDLAAYSSWSGKYHFVRNQAEIFHKKLPLPPKEPLAV